jgi:hypothetical protein
VAVIAKGFIDMGETHILNQDWDGLRKLMKAHFPTEDPEKIIPMLQKLMKANRVDRAKKLWHIYDDYDAAALVTKGLTRLVGKALVYLVLIGGVCGGVLYLFDRLMR